MTEIREVRTDARRRVAAVLGVALLSVACSTPSSQTNPPSTGVPSPSVGATSEPVVSASIPSEITPSAAPSASVVAPSEYGTILKVQVNRLAARLAPTPTAALVHAYNLSGPAPVDAGFVRLNKGDYVSVELGPLKVGDTVWYLVWPSKAGKFHVSDVDWYDKAPPGGTPGPAWVAASVGTAVYMTPFRQPDTTELESWEPAGLTGFGTGDYVLGTGPRHDAFLLQWGAAAPTPGTQCALKVSLAPDDSDFVPLAVLGVSTTSVKVAPHTGTTIMWPDAASSTWTTFTAEATGTCASSLRLVRLEHD